MRRASLAAVATRAVRNGVTSGSRTRRTSTSCSTSPARPSVRAKTPGHGARASSGDDRRVTCEELAALGRLLLGGRLLHGGLAGRSFLRGGLLRRSLLGRRFLRGCLLAR